MILQFRIVSTDTLGVIRTEGLYDTLEHAQLVLENYKVCFPLCQFEIQSAR